MNNMVSRRIIRGGSNEILLYVLPCGGGLVNVEVRHKKKIVISKCRVSGYGKFVIQNPIKGDRYVIRISAVSVDELLYFKHIQVFATIRPKLYPLPDLPPDVNVREYTSMQDCTSTTIGWLPVENNNFPVTYCVYIKEDDRKPKKYMYEINGSNRKPDQCNLDFNMHKSSTDFAFIQCKQEPPASNSGREVITRKLTNLKPGYDYTVQVTAKKYGFHRLSYNKKHDFQSLSYDILRIHKNNSCS